MVSIKFLVAVFIWTLGSRSHRHIVIAMRVGNFLAALLNAQLYVLLDAGKFSSVELIIFWVVESGAIFCQLRSDSFDEICDRRCVFQVERLAGSLASFCGAATVFHRYKSFMVI